MTPEFIAAMKKHLSDNLLYPGKDCYKDAVFFPWDEPPIGTKVIKMVGKTEEIGIVVGNVNADFMHPHVRTCHTCSCEKILPPVGCAWWEIQMLAGTAKGYKLLEYPPALKPYKG